MLWVCRKAKQSMLTEGIQGLQKLKKKGKGVNKTIIEEREKQVWHLVLSLEVVMLGSHSSQLHSLCHTWQTPCNAESAHKQLSQGCSPALERS